MKRLAIIDDEPMIGEVLQELLSDYFVVEYFSDPRDFLKEDLVRDFDIVLTDIKMPYLDGFELIEKVKPLASPSTLFLVLTGHALTEKDFEKAKSLGAAKIFSKPFSDIQSFVSEIDRLLPQ